jgi:hypothetical protein
MKTTNTIGIALALTCSLAATLQAQDIYVASYEKGSIGEYTTSGATVNASLISGLHYPSGIAISGNDLFVLNDSTESVEEYTTSGTPVDASLITGLSDPLTIAISPVPEPSTIALAGLGAAAFCLLRRRK